MQRNSKSFPKTLRTAQKFSAGFSLIEVLVSLSIFTVVVTIAVGSLMVLITANSRAQHTQSIMTNMTYALDSLTREVRTGTDYYCAVPGSLPTSGETTADCASGSTGFSFNEGGVSLTAGASSRRIAYRLNANAIERRLGNGSWLPVTSPNISVTDLRFYVTGTSRTDSVAPTLTLYVTGTAGDAADNTATAFNIQTSIVQQVLDI